MASWYVYSGATGAGTGADWANAKTTLAAAISTGAAGDTYYVAHDHDESSAGALTQTFKGSASAPDIVLCVNRAGSVPPASADLTKRGGQVRVTGDATLLLNRYAYIYGLVFKAGRTGLVNSGVGIANDGGGHGLRLEGCLLENTANSAAGAITFGNVRDTGRQIELIDTQVKFGNSGSGLVHNACRVLWRDTPSAIQGTTLPTALFVDSSNSTIETGGTLTLDGVDLSALGSGKTIFGARPAPHAARLINCKLAASVTVAATPSAPGAATTDLLISDGSGTGYRQERYWYQGTLTPETTVVRSGGASDGTTALTWKVATTANASWCFPFETFEAAVWVDTAGASKSITVESVTDGVTLKNDECWIEAQVMDASGHPGGTLYSSGKADVLATGANNTTSSASWTTTGLASPVKQKMSVTFINQIKGYVRVVVKVAKASATVYVDPLLTVS